MRIGITLPQFRDDAEPALEVARQAELAGIDGVFVFDHLWPIGQPHRPALHSLVLLGALVAETSRVSLGPLVARVGLVPAPVLLHGLSTLHRMAGDRLIVGLGTGDSINRDENLAYGRPFAPSGPRLCEVVETGGTLADAGIRVWVGGRSAATRRAAATVGGWNCWGGDAEDFAEEAAGVRQLNPSADLSWGGQVLIGRNPAEAAAKLAHTGPRHGLISGVIGDLKRHLGELARTGASWAICAPLDVGADPGAVEAIAAARP